MNVPPRLPAEGLKTGRARRQQVANACLPCRTAKLRCSGTHPKCVRCHDRGIPCIYDVNEGMTKRQQLRFDLTEQRHELDRAISILSYMQEATDLQSTETLARLRIGENLESVYQRIQHRHTAAGSESSALANESDARLTGSDQEETASESDLAAHNERLLNLLEPRTQSADFQSAAHRTAPEPYPPRPSSSAYPSSIDSSREMDTWMGFEHDAWPPTTFQHDSPSNVEQQQTSGDQESQDPNHPPLHTQRASSSGYESSLNSRPHSQHTSSKYEP